VELASFLLLPSPLGFFALSLLMPRRWYLAHAIGLIIFYVTASVYLIRLSAASVVDLDVLLTMEGSIWLVLLLATMAASAAGIVIRLLYEASRLLYRAVRTTPAVSPIDES
jgi:hypothetical protein